MSRCLDKYEIISRWPRNNEIDSSNTTCFKHYLWPRETELETNKKIAYKVYSDISTAFFNESNSRTETMASNYFEYDVTANDYDTGTTAFYSPIYYKDGGLAYTPVVAPPGERIRQMIRDRMGPAIRRSRTSLSIAMDVREERARQTLRRVIGEQAFRKFVRDGFITVVPKSGLTYRIYPGYGITEVYDKGIMVDRLCVVLQGNFPPTDSLLMRYLLILNDEGEFSKHAIQHSVCKRSKATKLVLPVEPLTEAWTRLKVA